MCVTAILSLCQVWLCGGRVVNVPCSRVGHMEMPGGRDYRATWRSTILKNYNRFAKVWLGEYIRYFYMFNPEARVSKNAARNLMHFTTFII